MMNVKQKLQLNVLICIVLFIVLAVFAVRPLFRSIKNASERMALEKAIFSALKIQTASLDNFQKDYSANQPILTQTKEGFVDFKAPVDFIEFLEEQAFQDNVYLDVLPLVSFSQQGDPWQVLNFQIIIAGSFVECRRFLETLENGTFLIDIFQFSIERINQKSSWLKRFSGLKTGDTVYKFNLKTFSTNEQ